MAKVFTTENFQEEVINSEKLVLVDFSANWCGPCQMIGSVIEELAEELEGKVSVGKVNVDENQELAQKYSVMSIPTIIVFKNGKQTGKVLGAVGKDQLLELISKA
ncbi:MAG: thioredoxin [Patescibacteria group bacterium]|nr:thioredoxin [Patescibacteria group bacterium]